eukprot:symbB.v1.2.039506.t1/scaffold6613.1/size16708/1
MPVPAPAACVANRAPALTLFLVAPRPCALQGCLRHSMGRSTFPAMNAAEAPEHPPKTPRSLRCLQAHSKPLSYHQRTFVHYVHKVDSALRSAASGLETQIRRRVEDADAKEANRACYRLLVLLQERHQARAQRFETFALTYLLKAPQGPALAPHDAAGNMALGRSSEVKKSNDEITGLAVPDAWKPKESQVFLEQEITKVQAQLLQAVRKSHALHQESAQLKQRLSLAQAAEEATGCGLRHLAKDLREVVQQVGQLTGKDRTYIAEMRQQASPQKRHSFLEDIEADEWSETPKRQRFSLLG